MAIKTTRTTKTTATKPRKSAATTAKPLRANPVVEAPVAPLEAEPKIVKRKELVERIAAASGLKPNAIKSALDPILKEIGDSLSAGEILQVQPLGRLSVNRRKDLENGEVMICKLRRRSADPHPKSEIDL
ncbi:MAG: HU family DNA-binding protein [Marinosulfonomonas sp.]